VSSGENEGLGESLKEGPVVKEDDARRSQENRAMSGAPIRSDMAPVRFNGDRDLSTAGDCFPLAPAQRAPA
jgi:hypothetical protein